MKNFGRAIRLALKQRLTVLGILVSSCLVALFWGANISAVYPVVEIVFQNKSINDWVEESIVDSRRRCTQLEAEQRRLAQQAQKAAAADQPEVKRKLADTRDQLRAEQRALKLAIQLQPFARAYLPDDAFRTLILIVLFLLVGTLLKCLCLATNILLVAKIAEGTALQLRNDFFRHILEMELAAFGKGRTSDLMSRVTGDIGAISASVGFLFGKSVREPMKMIVCIVGAACISWRLLLLSLLVTPVAGLGMYCLARSIKRANRRLMEEMARLFGRLSQSFTGILVVKAYTMERFEASRFRQITRQLYRKVLRLSLYESLTRLNNELLGVGVICLAILAGGYLVISQDTHLLGVQMTSRPLTFGSVMLFFAFLAGVSDPARKLADVVNVIQRGAAAADRVYPLLDRQSAIQDPPTAQPLGRIHSDLIFDRVSFHYVPGRPVLRDICLRIPFGETLAIVGANGSGKSTLIQLIGRFYDPVKGEVRLGNVSLKQVSLRELRSQIGLVTQQTVLFDDTVMNNIRYGSPDASDEQVIEAARKAHAHRFITQQLEHGYQTNVGEHGGQLSGGQRQRIALARAILRDPAILILDEATSEIDPESEHLIHQALEQFIRGRTTIMITHRMSTLDLADRILVMDRGRITDMGSHEELIARCPLFQRLYQRAFRESA